MDRIDNISMWIPTGGTDRLTEQRNETGSIPPIFSRLDPGLAQEGEFPRFLCQQIFNSKGVAILWHDLFSQRKSDEAREFFLNEYEHEYPEILGRDQTKSV